MNKKVCVLLCTYNRKICLEKVLNALSNQTHKITGIVVVDNHSTDGTLTHLNTLGLNLKEKINEVQITNFNNIKFYYYLNEKNEGGAGGFKKAFEIGLILRSKDHCLLLRLCVRSVYRMITIFYFLMIATMHIAVQR